MNNKENKLLIAAIEIGTLDSRYAFVFKNDDISRISTISVSDGKGNISNKWPTCLLFTPDGTFHSFGYEAENKYSDLAAYDVHRKWYYFQRFKPILQSKEIRRDMEIQDDKGLTMPAKKVFGCAIRFLKMHLMNNSKTAGSGIEEKDIHWVLTVPAIRNRNDVGKQFMREAAVVYAEIDSRALTIASEPEAISSYCQWLTSDKLSAQGMLTAAKYMILNLGTSDIILLERKADGSIRELHQPATGAWKGTKVDEAFHQLLIKIIGAKTLKTFLDHHKADHDDLLRDLETKKKKFSPASGGRITLKIPVSLNNLYEQESGETIADALKETPLKDKMIWIADKIQIESNLFKDLYKDCIDGITQCVMEQSAVNGLDTILMVGEFSESPMMQAAMKEAFSNSNIIISGDAELVLKGAVVFGREPIKTAKHTYGISIASPFDVSVHPQEKRVVVGGKERCKDVFKKCIQKGQSIRIGEKRSGKHASLKPNQKQIFLKVYASAARNSQFITDPGCKYVGTLVVKLPEEQEIFKVNVDMMFGQAELLVEAEEESSRRKFRSYFYLL